MSGRHVPAVLGLLAASLIAVAQAGAFDVGVEAKTFAKTQERASIYATAQYQLQLRTISAQNAAAAVAAQVADPEREFQDHLCTSGMDGCAGDTRLYDWQAKGYGVVQPVLFTARSGATLSGHVWATKAGPAKRPAVVIVNGSVQADEQMYWYAAQTLAKNGYVVLTFDPQGQGQSDTPGEGADLGEGVPAQTDGRPFYDGGQDALDFLLSTPDHPYLPRTSCSTGTSHAAKQQRRVKAGLDAAYNPLAALVDPSRVGMVGHSYGAGGVSYEAQLDPRVKAVVAYDNLAVPDPGTKASTCPGHPGDRDAKPITKPGLGISGDYGLPPTPHTSDPDPLSKSQASLAYTKAGVDTGEIVIRGATHLDFDWIPNPGFGATLRGADMIAWYTTAWMDKYVKGDPTADARLLTDRWRHDGQEAAIDLDGDGNMFSSDYYRSRLDVGRTGGSRFLCEDLRTGCGGGLTADDGFRGTFDYVALAHTPDVAGAGSVPKTMGLTPVACTSRRRIVLHVRPIRGRRVTRVVALVGPRRVGRSTTRRVSVSLLGLPRGSARVRLRVTAVRHRRAITVTQARTFRTCAGR